MAAEESKRQQLLSTVERVQGQRPIAMSEVSQAVSDAATIQVATNKYIRSLRFSAQGEVSVMEDEPESVDAKVINYLTSEGFEDLNVKLYSVRELENLLGSTDIH